MRIINPAVRADLDASRPLKLNLGSGTTRLEGFYSVDLLELPGIDIVADLNEPLQELPDNSVGEIYSSHTLEHLRDLVFFLREIHRVTRPDGIIRIVVPHFSNPYYYSDPTHIRFFGLYTMYYFVDPEKQPHLRSVPHFYTDIRFRVDRVWIGFYGRNLLSRFLVRIAQKLFNSRFRIQDFYERHLCWLFPAWDVRYTIRTVKDR